MHVKGIHINSYQRKRPSWCTKVICYMMNLRKTGSHKRPKEKKTHKTERQQTPVQKPTPSTPGVPWCASRFWCTEVSRSPPVSRGFCEADAGDSQPQGQHLHAHLVRVWGLFSLYVEETYLHGGSATSNLECGKSWHQSRYSCFCLFDFICFSPVTGAMPNHGNIWERNDQNLLHKSS